MVIVVVGVRGVPGIWVEVEVVRMLDRGLASTWLGG